MRQSSPATNLIICLFKNTLKKFFSGLDIGPIIYNVWYNYGFLMLCALFLFEGFSRLPLKKEYKTILWLSRNSFGIYLIHYPILLLLKNIILQMSCMMPVKVIFLWIIVLGVSCCFCYVINISPKLSRLLLYNR